MANGNGHQPQAVLAAERMAPHSVEAEQAVLGAILNDNTAWFQVAGTLTPEDFFIVRHGWAFDAMRRLKGRNEAIDNISLAEELRQMGKLDEFGGSLYISKLMLSTPIMADAETHSSFVERSAIRRNLLTAAGQIAKLAHDEQTDINEVIGSAEQELFSVTQRRTKKRDPRIARALIAHSNDLDWRAEMHRQGKLTGVPTGFKELDQLMGGLQKGRYVILAARPGVGKTSLQLNIALNAARAGARVGVMSLEMDEKQLLDRLIAQETGISTTLMRDGNLDDRQWALYYEAMDRLSKLPILLDHTPAMQPMAMRSLAHRWHGEYGLDLILLDYIGLMRIPGISPEARNALLTEVSMVCVQTCRELNVPMIVASQLSRDLEKRKDKRPILSDLRDSGSLEQDADAVWFIYRDEMYDENTEYPNQADIIIAKHRHGPTGTISLYFRKELTQFADLTKTTIDLGAYASGGDVGQGAVKAAPQTKRSAGYTPGR